MSDSLSVELDQGLGWLCDGAPRMLHYGCGDGEILRRCAGEFDTRIHIGVDPSPKLILKAKRLNENINGAQFYYRCGGVAELRTLLANSFDAALLWGAVDALPQAEGEAVLAQVLRLLDKKGKLLLKLGGFSGQGEDAQVDKTPLLWGRTVGEWRQRFEADYIVKPFKDIYIRKSGKHEGLFMLQKPETEEAKGV